MPARARNATIIARPHRMMSRMVTTSSADTSMSVPSATNSASSTDPPPRTKTSSAGVVMTAPAIAATRRLSQARICRLLRVGVRAAGAARVVAVAASGAEEGPSAAAALAAAAAAAACRGDGRRQHRQEPGPVDEPALLHGALEPVPLAMDVADLGLAVDRGERHEVDHRLRPARMGKLEFATVAERVVRAGIDADPAQDAAALVHLVFLEDARLGHERPRRTGFRAPPARHARGVVEAHIQRGRDERVEADPHEVVTGGTDDFGTHVGAAAAVDAAGRFTQDERVAVVPDVVVVDPGEPVLGHAPIAGALVVLRLERLERGAVLDPEPAQVAEPDRLAGALEAAGRLGHGLRGGVRDLVFDVARVPDLGLERLPPVAGLLDLGRERHDGQELGLGLGQRLARLDRRQVVGAG